MGKYTDIWDKKGRLDGWIAVSRSHWTLLLPIRCCLWAFCIPLSFSVMSFRRATLSFTDRVCRSCSTKEFLSIFSYNKEERSDYLYGCTQNIIKQIPPIINKNNTIHWNVIYTLFFLHFLMAWMVNPMDRLKRTVNKTGKSCSTAYTKAGVYLEDWVFTRALESPPLDRSGHVVAQTGSREST